MRMLTSAILPGNAVKNTPWFTVSICPPAPSEMLTWKEPVGKVWAGLRTALTFKKMKTKD